MSVVVIAIAGGTASGKTTVAKKLYNITNKNGDVNYIKMDDYYKKRDDLTFEERTRLNYDHPDSIDFDLLVSHIEALKNGNSIEKPTYDFSNHIRSDVIEHVKGAKVIILEGILALVDERIRNLANIKIYVDTPDDIRFIRRLTRDMKERGRGVESVISQYKATVRPMHMQFVEPSKKFADVIIPEGGHNPIVIDLFASKICSIINEKML